MEARLMSDKEIMARMKELSKFTGPAWENAREEYYDLREELKARR